VGNPVPVVVGKPTIGWVNGGSLGTGKPTFNINTGKMQNPASAIGRRTRMSTGNLLEAPASGFGVS
jgi:hypothetical protein